jgi:hypothetical protein
MWQTNVPIIAGRTVVRSVPPIPDLERQVPKMGRCLCPEKCRGRGEEAGAEDGQVREGKARIHAMDGAGVPGARPAAGRARRQPKAAIPSRLTYGLPMHYRCAPGFTARNHPHAQREYEQEGVKQH